MIVIDRNYHRVKIFRYLLLTDENDAINEEQIDDFEVRWWQNINIKGLVGIGYFTQAPHRSNYERGE